MLGNGGRCRQIHAKVTLCYIGLYVPLSLVFFSAARTAAANSRIGLSLQRIERPARSEQREHI